MELLGSEGAGFYFKSHRARPDMYVSYKPLEALEFENPDLNFPLTHIRAHNWYSMRTYFLHLQMPPDFLHLQMPPVVFCCIVCKRFITQRGKNYKMEQWVLFVLKASVKLPISLFCLML